MATAEAIDVGLGTRLSQAVARMSSFLHGLEPNFGPPATLKATEIAGLGGSQRRFIHIKSPTLVLVVLFENVGNDTEK